MSVKSDKSSKLNSLDDVILINTKGGVNINDNFGVLYVIIIIVTYNTPKLGILSRGHITHCFLKENQNNRRCCEPILAVLRA